MFMLVLVSQTDGEFGGVSGREALEKRNTGRSDEGEDDGEVVVGVVLGNKLERKGLNPTTPITCQESSIDDQTLSLKFISLTHVKRARKSFLI